MVGKRHIGQFSVFDLIIAVTLGAVAGADLADLTAPHTPTIVAIIGLGALHWLVSRLVLSHRLAAKFMTLDPTIVMENGRIIVENLSKTRYSVDELLSHLRANDVFDLSQVEFAVLESHGELSVLKRSQRRPVTPKDLSTPTQYEGLPATILLEGQIQRDALHTLHLTDEWLYDSLMRMGYTGPEQIFLGQINTQGQLYISPYKSPVPPQKLSH